LTGWLQIEFALLGNETSQAEELLDSLEALSVTLLDGGDEVLLQPIPGSSPVWQQTLIRALFPLDSDPTTIHTYLKNKLNCQDFRSETLEDQDWERTWMDDFKAMHFGEQLWVCPSWQIPPEPNAVNLMLDPGLAFGSGSHATTALCLEWLATNPPQELTVIDYGCGSGVLSLAALKLGANKVYAVDIDEHALQATLSNASKNNLPKSKLLISLPQQLIDTPADLLMANILCGPLLELAPHVAKLIKSGGSIILSGILEDQAELITNIYASWFDLLTLKERNGWVLVHGQKKAEPYKTNVR
jgi:ribosomal protein L11 methyltransferase